MAYDALLQLQAPVTKTGTFQGPALDLTSAGTALAGLVARVIYSAAQNASGSNSVTYSIEHSDDASTWYTIASGAVDAVALSTTVQGAEIFMRFSTRKRYVRLVATFAGAGSTPTITYSADIGLTIP